MRSPSLLGGGVVLAALIETILIGSPVRWWVVALAVAAGIALRTGWAPVATWPSLVLVGLAVTSWLPQGTVNGVRLFGLETHRLLALAVAAGIVTAVVAICRTRQWPVSARSAGGLLGLCGAAVFAVAAATGTPVGALLSGSVDGFLRLLLHGAVLGVCLVLPLGMVAVAVTSGLRGAPRAWPVEASRQAVAMLATVAIVVATVPRFEAVEPKLVAARSGETSHASQVPPPAVTAAPASLEGSLRALEDGLGEAPRDRWDPQFVVAQVGTRPDQLLGWVRENTVWIPYQGTLRGAVGVLNDRMGNSLDRAVLLATLLQRAGHDARLARRQLSSQQAAQMASWSILAPTPPEEPGPGTDHTTAALGELATQYGLDPKVVAHTVETQTRILDDLVAEIDARVADQTARLLGSIDRSSAGQEWRRRVEAAIAAAADHWWVQWRNGESWTDLDLLDHPASGVAPAETMSLDDLANLHHRLTISVVAEQWKHGGRAEHTVLTHTVLPAALEGRSLLLQFWPADWPVPGQPDAREPRITDLALRQRSWDVGLAVGDAVVAEGSITDTGGPAAEGSSFGALGRALQSSLSGQRQPDAALSAVWIDYEIHAPGAHTRRVRREVFDLVGATGRESRRPLSLTEDLRLQRALSLMTRSEILPINCAFSREFVADLVGRRLLADSHLLLAAARGDVTGNPEQVDQWMKDSRPPATPLYALAMARLEWSRHREQILIDRLNVLARHRFFAASSTGLVVRDATDIVANEVGVELPVVDAIAVRVEQGVLDTNAERMLQAGGDAAASTAEAFAASADWLISGPTLEGFQLPSEALRRMSADLARGLVVIAPRAPIAMGAHSYVGWWRIDPATGDTLGVAANGWGQAMGERAVKYNVIVVVARQFVFDYALCQAIPMIANAARPLVIELFGAPSWVTVPKQKSTGEMYQENFRGCMIAAIASGAVFATLPLLLATLRYTVRGLAILPRLGVRPSMPGPRWGARPPGRPAPPRPPRPAPDAPSSGPGPKPPCA